MADNAKHEYTPEELAQARVGASLSGAVHPTETPAGGHTPEAGQPHPTPHEVAEETRRAQQARPDDRPDRDDRLVHVGRGQQTSGRQ